MRKINKTLYYCKCYNFGDELNKYLFEKVFEVQFNYCTDAWMADYLAIGSVLGLCSDRKLISIKQKILFILNCVKGRYKLSKLTVLGAGFIFWSNEQKIKYLRKMDFKIVRGKLTENYLRQHNLLEPDVLLGDLGLLCSYMVDYKVEKKYKLGIIPHYMDLDSPVVYDIYKKYGDNNCIIINVQDDVRSVIKQITECENVIASSLHGLIIADSFNIPNLWFQNTLRYFKMENQKELDEFKYKDYYSIYEIDDISPINILDIANINIDDIAKAYKIRKEDVQKKQKELYDYCKMYFETLTS